MHTMRCLLLLVMVMAGSAQAEELRWQTRQSAEGVMLAYEQPETDYQPVFFACRLPDRRLLISLEHSRERVRAGREAEVTFASEAGRVVFRLRAERMELNDQILLRGEAPFDPALVRLLAEGRTLRVTIAGETERFPLTGARQGAMALGAACR